MPGLVARIAPSAAFIRNPRRFSRPRIQSCHKSRHDVAECLIRPDAVPRETIGCVTGGGVLDVRRRALELECGNTRCVQNGASESPIHVEACVRPGAPAYWGTPARSISFSSWRGGWTFVTPRPEIKPAAVPRGAGAACALARPGRGLWPSGLRGRGSELRFQRAAPEPKGRVARATRRGRASCDARSRSTCWRAPAAAGG
jgi:hypothetical protein